MEGLLWAVNIAALIVVLGAVGAVVVGVILMPLSKFYYYIEEIPDEENSVDPDSVLDRRE